MNAIFVRRVIGDPKNPNDERLFYWDVCKPAPVLQIGDWVEIGAHGNAIIGFHVGNR
jgi:hypothetical protein